MEIIRLQGKLIGDTENSWNACYFCNAPAECVAQSLMPVTGRYVLTALCKHHKDIIEKQQNDKMAGTQK